MNMQKEALEFIERFEKTFFFKFTEQMKTWIVEYFTMLANKE